MPWRTDLGHVQHQCCENNNDDRLLEAIPEQVTWELMSNQCVVEFCLYTTEPDTTAAYYRALRSLRFLKFILYFVCYCSVPMKKSQFDLEYQDKKFNET